MSYTEFALEVDSWLRRESHAWAEKYFMVAFVEIGRFMCYWCQ